MNSIISSGNISNSNTGVQQTQNPKQIHGETQIGDKTVSTKIMDTSFSLNTLEKSGTFLSNAKELHQKREVHQKGIFRANYENTSGFGTVKQFFKNIKLLFQKNDMNALQNTCLQRCLQYTDNYSMAVLSRNKIQQNALKAEISSVIDGLEQIKGKQELNDKHPISKTLIALKTLQDNFKQQNFNKQEINKSIQKEIVRELENPSQE